MLHLDENTTVVRLKKVFLHLELLCLVVLVSFLVLMDLSDDPICHDYRGIRMSEETCYSRSAE